ncbi:hypothetical protein [Bradyrhizobium canariense]|uniref:hypothetical protein n=1 Tax=Bradyrhizobium canariense TaxID=255045 RepID=UPI000C24EA71|nr:hypothetical protein [Bradyrhizobium canariense]
MAEFRVEKGRLRAHIQQMEHINKCTSVLRPLMTEGDTNGVPLAETALNEMVAVTPAPEQRAALEHVQSVVQAHRDEASGIQLRLADAINNYIEKLMRSLE